MLEMSSRRWRSLDCLRRAYALHCELIQPQATNCWDNAVMERFFLNLKMERVWRRDYANSEEARADIADYIVGFYNSERLHSTLGYRSPNDFRATGNGCLSSEIPHRGVH